VAGRLPTTGGLERGPAVTITVDGLPVTAYAGETVAAALLAEGVAATRRTPGGAPRGVFCGMGVCFDCLAVVDGLPNTRTCMTWARDGMDVRLHDGPAAAAPRRP
jgi:predicted molibdopterin-dependent oxidoreductase YjgC